MLRKSVAAVLVVALLTAANLAIAAPDTSNQAEDFRYSRFSWGVIITKYHGDSPDVIVPEIIGGGHVCAIDAEAFAWNPYVTHVTLPNSVQFIGIRAFIGCDHLEEVEWSDRLQGIGLEAFQDCERLKSVRLKPGALYISQSAFAGCTALEEVVLPKSMYDIGPNAFQNCTGLRSASVLGSPTGSIFVEDAPFAGCTDMQQFTYGGTEEFLDELLPPELRYTIPTFLTEYDESSRTVEIRSCLAPAGELVIPEQIGDAQVVSFGDDAFAGSPDVERVFYLGTRAQWERIDKGDGNSPIEDGNVVCLARNPLSEPIAPAWNEPTEYVTGISLASLGDMPLRGVDLIAATWAAAPSEPSSPEPTVSAEPGPSASASPDEPAGPEPSASTVPEEPEPLPSAAPEESAAAEPSASTDPGEPEARDADAPAEPEPSASPNLEEPPASEDPEPSASTDRAAPGESDGAAAYEYSFFTPEGEALSRYDILGTDCIVARISAGDETEQQARIVIAGDVTGSGIMNISQLVRLAQALSGSSVLEGAYAAAADVDGNGRFDIADLTTEAAWLLQSMSS